MRRLPLPDPGTPDTRSTARFFLWLVNGQRRTLAVGAAFGVLWMLSQAVMPLVVGRALDRGVAQGSVHALVAWTGNVIPTVMDDKSLENVMIENAGDAGFKIRFEGDGVVVSEQ